MTPLAVDQFFRSQAPVDVRETVAWLLANGYSLLSHQGEGTFGALFVFVGEAEVRITVDRSQWFLDVAHAPGAEAWQYDLLVAARSGQPYGERFPATDSKPLARTLPEQLPEGASWRQTLPGVLAWVRGPGVDEEVERALRGGTRACGRATEAESVTRI